MFLNPDPKTIELLVKLNRLTSTGKIQWSLRDPPASLIAGTNDVIPLYMECLFKGQRFALFQQRYEAYDPDRDRMYWAEREVFAILDAGRRVLWEGYSFGSALSDLFTTARRKVADIDAILGNLLDDDD
jgi:hypothetical protein